MRGNNACRHWCQDISGGILFERRADVRGKCELRPAVKKLYHLRQVEQIPIMRVARKQMLNLKFNKASTNKICQFLENIVPVNETSEQNSNGYCNVDFVFTLYPTNVSCICGVKVIFNIMNLYLFLKCIPSDFKSLSSLW